LTGTTKVSADSGNVLIGSVSSGVSIQAGGAIPTPVTGDLLLGAIASATLRADDGDVIISSDGTGGVSISSNGVAPNPGNGQVLISGAAGVTIFAGDALTPAATDDAVRILAEGNASVQADGNLSLTADGNINITGSGANSVITVDSSRGLRLPVALSQITSAVSIGTSNTPILSIGSPTALPAGTWRVRGAVFFDGGDDPITMNIAGTFATYAAVASQASTGGEDAKHQTGVASLDFEGVGVVGVTRSVTFDAIIRDVSPITVALNARSPSATNALAGSYIEVVGF
jgi:hypothetical protein